MASLKDELAKKAEATKADYAGKRATITESISALEPREKELANLMSFSPKRGEIGPVGLLPKE